MGARDFFCVRNDEDDYDEEIEYSFCNLIIVLFTAIFSFSGPIFLALNTVYLTNG